jgi:hypothetical protein
MKMSYVYAVTINDHAVRVFTQRADAETFIATCEDTDDRTCWSYDIEKIELDGDPRGTI